MLSVVVLFFYLTLSVLGEENNVCPTFDDYNTIKNNSRCWYDFSADYNVPSVIRLNGYPVQEYKVPTKDGFILTMFRIPSKNPSALKFPIYLQHGLVSTCAYFVAIKRNSLAFVLADAGYDVWLGNYRGTEYSEEHVNMTVYDPEYWDHSMDEIVSYDFPALFHTITSNTRPDAQIVYIGHSLGTTLSLMYAAEYPEISKNNMKMMILMSPAYTLSNMLSPYKMAAPFGSAIWNVARELEIIRVISQAGPLRRAVRTVCLESPMLMQFCLQLYNLFYGPNTLFRPETIPVYFNFLPGGTALKILNHAADLVLGSFRKYNYLDKNYQYYGSLTPPIYDIKKIQVPVYLFYSAQDWATTERDALNLWRQLPNSARLGMTKIDLPKFNHMDFVFSKQAKKIVYQQLLQILNKHLAT